MEVKEAEAAQEDDEGHQGQAEHVVPESQPGQVTHEGTGHEAGSEEGSEGNCLRNQKEEHGNRFTDPDQDPALRFTTQSGEKGDRIRMTGELEIQGLRKDAGRHQAKDPGQVSGFHI